MPAEPALNAPTALPEQILPADVLGRDVNVHEAQKRLIEHAARAHGIGTAGDLADYFRMKTRRVARGHP